MMRKLIAGLILALSSVATAQIQAPDRALLGVQNLLPNPGFETGRAGFTASAGVFATATSGTNLLTGKVSGTWDASATGQNVQSALIAMPEGLVGRTCSARMRYRGGDANLTFNVLDGSSNTLSSQTLATAPTPRVVSLIFPCPASGASMRVRVASTADAALIAMDDFYLGELLPDSVAQATYIGGMEQAANSSGCTYAQSTSTGATDWRDLATGTSCNAWTTAGLVSAVGTNDHRFTINNMPAGDYLIVFAGALRSNQVGTGSACGWRLNDGTSAFQSQWQDVTTASGTINTLLFHASYTSAGTRTFRVQSADTISGGGCWVENAVLGLNASWKVYRFPPTTETVLRFDQTAWRVDANIIGANVALGTASVSTYTEATNGALTLTQNTGSIPVGIACSGTNASTVGASTCSVGNESVGVTFNVPTGGTDVLACASFAHLIDYSGTYGQGQTTFQLVETPSNAQTILQEGKARVMSGGEGTNVYNTYPHRLCGTFNFASAGQKTIRLVYEQLVSLGVLDSSNIIGDASASMGQRDIKFEVFPINQSFPMPLIVNSVTTTGTTERIERVRTSFCSADPCTILSQSGAVTSVNRGGAGLYTINFAAGTFSGVPACTFTLEVGGGNTNAFVCQGDANVAWTSTSVRTQCRQASSNVATDAQIQAICMGPR